MNEESLVQLNKSDFTIDRILSGDTKNLKTTIPREESTSFESKEEDVSYENNKKYTSIDNEQKLDTNELAWLRYTRYKPPKIQRKVVLEKPMKRRPGVHPRIPFSSVQLEILEERYKRNPYLCRKDVLEISAVLHLPQSRVRSIVFYPERINLEKFSRVGLGENMVSKSTSKRKEGIKQDIVKLSYVQNINTQ